MKPSMRTLSGATAALVLGALAAAPAAAAELARLLSPAPGTTLVAGSTVVLEWQPGADLAALPHADEWEVFLSLDGGRTFLSRLTPHLDLDRRRVSVHVPQLPSEDARLLLRVGNERDEREQALPGRYRIVLDHVLAPPWRWRRLGRGEPARPGQPGVLVWVEGGRDGSRWEECESERDPLAWEPAVAVSHARLRTLCPVRGAAPRLMRVPLGAFASRPAAEARRSTMPSAEAKAPHLSLLCRRNV